MSRLTSRITIAVLTFIIGTTITMIWFIHRPVIDKSVIGPASSDTSLSLCNLIRSSSDYDSKIVSVRAILIGYHEIALYDPDCKSEENYIKADFGSASRQKLIGAISTLNGSDFQDGNFEASVVLTGRFEKLQDEGDINNVVDPETINRQPVQYRFRLIVIDVDHAEPVTKNLSRP